MSENVHEVKIKHFYQVECYGPDGQLKWEDEFLNLVTTEGKNKYLDATLKTGLTSPAWYVGLVSSKTTGYNAADTLASHSGWVETVAGTVYTGARQAFTTGTISAGSVDNSASKASFAIIATDTINGAFLSSVSSGTSGTLLGVGDFSAAKGVSNGDTLQVTVTCSIT